MSRPEVVKNLNQDRQTARLSQKDELVLKVTKEIVIKFIEMGRCSPASFEEVFRLVFCTIKNTIQED